MMARTAVSLARHGLTLDLSPQSGSQTSAESTATGDSVVLRGVSGGALGGGHGGGHGGVSRLASLRSAGLVRRASERTDEGIEQTLPVGAALRPLLPGGRLRRGSTIVVGAGATSVLFALLAEASTAGSWCAVVGLPHVGLVAAAEAGVAVHRLAIVPRPGPDWVDTVAALVDGLDLVVVATPVGVAPAMASRLTARVRQRGGVLIPVGRWPGADLTIEVVGGAWHGLGSGTGRLRRREVELVASGRGAASHPRRARLWLPSNQAVPEPIPQSRPEPLRDLGLRRVS